MNQINWEKTVCRVDDDNIFIGTDTAELNIYSKDGSYIIPGGCIDADVPEVPADMAAQWNGNSWEMVADYRGKTAYRKDNAEEVIIEQAGEIPADLTLLKPQSPYVVWSGDQWVIDESRKEAEEKAALDKAKANALARLNELAQQTVVTRSGADSLPDFEVQSWSIQAAEARAWDADKSTATPVLDAIAAARGINSDDLKETVLRKCRAYDELVATVAGRRQAVQAQIEAAKSLDELNGVSVDFNV